MLLCRTGGLLTLFVSCFGGKGNPSSLLSMPVASFVATGTACGRHPVAASARGLRERLFSLRCEKAGPFPPSPPSLPQRALFRWMDEKGERGHFFCGNRPPERQKATAKVLLLPLFLGFSAFFAAVSAFDFFDGAVRFSFEKGKTRGGDSPRTRGKTALPSATFPPPYRPAGARPLFSPLRQTSGRGASFAPCR